MILMFIMKDSGGKVFLMDMAKLFFLIRVIMRVRLFEVIHREVMDFLYSQMDLTKEEIFIKDLCRAKESFIFQPRNFSMKVSGLQINHTEKGSKLTGMDQLMMENLKMD